MIGAVATARSFDFKARVVAAVMDGGCSLNSAARQFDVSRSAVQNWVKQAGGRPLPGRKLTEEAICKPAVAARVDLSDESLRRAGRSRSRVVRLVARWLGATPVLASRRNRLRALSDFAATMTRSGRSLMEPTTGDVEAWKQLRVREPPIGWSRRWSSSTRRSAVSHVRTFYRFALPSEVDRLVPTQRVAPGPLRTVQESVLAELVARIDAGEHLQTVAPALNLVPDAASMLYRSRTGRSVVEARAAARERRFRGVVAAYAAGASVEQVAEQIGLRPGAVVELLNAAGYTSRPGWRGAGWRPSGPPPPGVRSRRRSPDGQIFHVVAPRVDGDDARASDPG